MPLYRYKTFAEAERDLSHLVRGRASRFVFRLADRIGCAPCQRGLFRFRTLEEANEQRRVEEVRAAIAAHDPEDQGPP